MTPVLATPRSIVMPNDSRSSATRAAVRVSSNAVSGWAWMSCRHAIMSTWKSAMRLTIGIKRPLSP
jgi:hypothetical protein